MRGPGAVRGQSLLRIQKASITLSGGARSRTRESTPAYQRSGAWLQSRHSTRPRCERLPAIPRQVFASLGDVRVSVPCSGPEFTDVCSGAKCCGQQRLQRDSQLCTPGSPRHTRRSLYQRPAPARNTDTMSETSTLIGYPRNTKYFREDIPEHLGRVVQHHVAVFEG
jgi:hypothetical protein